MKHRQVVDPCPARLVDEVVDVLAVSEEAQLDSLSPGTEQPEIAVDVDTSIFTRHTNPFNPARISKILEVVEIGDDLTEEGRIQVQSSIREYADVYALSISEVKHIHGAVHRLRILDSAKFNTKIQQRRLTPPQTSYFAKAIDTMMEAGIIAPIAAADVKCVSPITLAAKAHGTGGMTIEEMHSKINEECARADLPRPFNLPRDRPIQSRISPRFHKNGVFAQTTSS